MGSKILMSTRYVQIFMPFGHLGAHGKGKQIFCTYVNSKFKKIEKKTEKYEILWDWRYSGAQDVCTFLLCLDIVRANGEKNQNLAQKNFEKMHYFFSLERLVHHWSPKLASTLCTQAFLKQKKKFNLNFVAIFFEFTVHRHKLFLFSFATSSRSVQPTQKCARALRTWLSSTPQNFRFFWFFCYFFLGGQSPLTGR